MDDPTAQPAVEALTSSPPHARGVNAGRTPTHRRTSSEASRASPRHAVTRANGSDVGNEGKTEAATAGKTAMSAAEFWARSKAAPAAVRANASGSGGSGDDNDNDSGSDSGSGSGSGSRNDESGPSSIRAGQSARSGALAANK